MVNPRKSTPCYIIIKIPNLKSNKRETNKKVTYEGKPIRLSADFSAQTFQARREW